jgi:hypothetical protein
MQGFVALTTQNYLDGSGGRSVGTVRLQFKSHGDCLFDMKNGDYLMSPISFHLFQNNTSRQRTIHQIAAQEMGSERVAGK